MTLLERARKYEEESGKIPWFSRLRRQNPKLYQEVLQVVQQYHNGELAHRFRSANALARFLCREIGEAVGVKSEQTFYRFLKETYDGRAVEEGIRSECDREVADGARERSAAQGGRRTRKKT